MSEKRNLEYSIFKWFERKLSWFIVFKKITFETFLLVFVSELSFIVGVGLKMSFYYIIRTKRLLT